MKGIQAVDRLLAMLIKCLIIPIAVSLLLGNPYLTAQILTVQNKSGAVELMVSSELKDIGYQIERSVDLWDWVGSSNHSVGSQTFTIQANEAQSAFYRLNLWQLPLDETSMALVGDSTIMDFSYYSGRVGGWGEGFEAHFKDELIIVNLAQPGQSTKTYLESVWQVQNLKFVAADFVFIQFGMIDELSGQPEKRTSMEEYQANLESLVGLVRSFGGTPILVTPLTLRKFDPDGKVIPYLNERSDAVLEVARSQGCPSINLNRLTKQLYQDLGDANSDGFTHTDQLHLLAPGAKVISRLVADNVPEFLQAYRVID